MWAVGLEKVMLTGFDIAPHTRFERHSHAAEQITLVLEGCFSSSLGAARCGSAPAR